MFLLSHRNTYPRHECIIEKCLIIIVLRSYIFKNTYTCSLLTWGRLSPFFKWYPFIFILDISQGKQKSTDLASTASVEIEQGILHHFTFRPYLKDTSKHMSHAVSTTINDKERPRNVGNMELLDKHVYTVIGNCTMSRNVYIHLLLHIE